MVNPGDLIHTNTRSTLEGFAADSLKGEAMEGSVVKKRLFRHDIYKRKLEEVYLPILIMPGVASSGLYVEKSSLNKSYEGVRLWMNPAFLARGRLNRKVLNADDIDRAISESNSSSWFGGRGNGDEDGDGDGTFAFGKSEEELAVKNSWIHHIGLDKNMIDEKPGNKVRSYDGLFGCEYLVDNAIAKEAGWVFGPMVDYCTNVMGYEREKSIDAVPYDWRLAPSINEKRDGYLTKTMERVECMYEENDGLPIVLVCHSMGAKMGHYFLNFAKKQKGREWLDKYIHTYMPVGAPTGGVACAVRCGVTGVGLDDTVDALVGNVADGLMMYRSWSCGNWLMPRMLPPGIFPTCIVRREGELGLTLTSEIEVGPLFRKRDKPPKELRLTVIFRDRLRAHSEFHPVVFNKSGNDPHSMTVSFHETFYMAVPYLGDEDELGELIFYLEEPAGRVNQNKTEFGKQFSKATHWARQLKKKASKFARDFAKKWGTVLRVAVSDRPMVLCVSDFDRVGMKSSMKGKYQLETDISIVGCIGSQETQEIIEYSDSEDEDDNGDNAQSLGRNPTPSTEESIGCISVKLSYSPPPTSSGTEPSPTPIAMINDDTPVPPILSKPNKLNIISFDRVEYDVWNGTDVFKADGFVEPMFDLVEKVYEGDPLGPTTESALDAPPVNCVRSIYGINVPTEVGAIYRKVPVVTIGDNKADCRYMLDKSACFPPAAKILYNNRDDPWSKLNLLTYKIDGGIVKETPRTLQNVPGQSEQRRVCGDGTVPYWNMVHALTWKDKIDTLTVDELDGAGHRPIVGDDRFFALLKRYCKVVDPRKNAMLMMKEQTSKSTGAGISGLGLSVDNFSSSASVISTDDK